jgi:diguanylate cyclase (GGDEF)-like protein
MVPSMRGFRWYATVVLTATVVHQFLPASARPLSYTLVSAATIVPLGVLVRRTPRSARLAWCFLLAAMSTLTSANALTTLVGPQARMAAEAIVTVAHALMLAGALTLVMRRGRNDLGGLIDASVVTMGLGALLWTSVLEPRLAEMRAPLGARIALLVSVFVLTGVMGSLGRLLVTADRRLPALELLILALFLALVGNMALAMTTGSMTTNRAPLIEVLFMVCYLSVGLAALHPSAGQLTEPGAAVVNRLSKGRLVFLGVAMLLSPVVGGVRDAVGLPTDGLLIALGSLSVGSLVMIRIGLLAAQRERAEHALVHEVSHDGLTGLPNRAELLNRLEAALDRERVSGLNRVVLLFCDLDGFKPVNDRLGHAAGDQLLREIADRITARLRSEETLARFGGDEFVLVCEALKQREAADRIRKDIEQALARPFDLSGELVRVGVSVGAVISDGRTHADELLRLADEAMYRTKQHRKSVPVHAAAIARR